MNIYKGSVGVIVAIFFLTACSGGTQSSDSSGSMGGGHAAVPIVEPIVEPTPVVEPIVEPVVAQIVEPAVEKKVAANPAPSYSVGKVQTFSATKFEQAVKDDQKILLNFHADWCHVCRGNTSKIKSAVEASGDVVGFTLNYDTAEEMKQIFRVVAQSTIVLLNGNTEVNRVLGSQSDASMTAFLQ